MTLTRRKISILNVTRIFEGQFIFKYIIRSQSGFSMAESAIATGLLGVVALGVASMAGSLGDQARRAEGLVARTEFTSSLNTYLGSTLGCEDLKTASNNGAAYSNSAAPIALSKWNYQGLSRIEGGYQEKGAPKTRFRFFEMPEFDAFLNPIADSQTVTAAAPGGGTEELYKNILTVRLTLLISGREYKHVYNVPVLQTNGGIVRICSDEKNIAESCAAMKGTYDAINHKCKLADACLLRGTYNVLSCDNPPCDQKFGAPKLNEFTNAATCPANSEAVSTHSSNWSSTRECGKKCTTTVNNSMQWFNCMDCP